MSLQIFTNPSHGLAQVCYSNRISCKVRLSRVPATPPSSILLQMDESNDFPESDKGFDSRKSLNRLPADSFLRQGNTVGIIGGVSTNSTLNFVRKLDDWSSKDGKSSLPLVLCSDPALNKELLLYEDNSYPSLYHRAEGSTPVDPEHIVENLRNKRRSLERCGAKLILMPCHIAHTWYEEVCEGSSVPLLHMGDCIAKELEEAKMKPLEAGNPLRVGVMATSATLSAGFYQERLQRNGFEAVIPDKATMEHTVIPAVEAMKRDDMEGARNLLRIALQVLLVQAVNVVVLGSDEMRELLPGDDPLLKKCVDPMDALARSAIKWAESR
uniref:Putative amino-acid racemase n=1 Tax=Noccaea caerulescens TaxID=107243 RepID=A0A1J3DB54_NOCCA